MSCNTCFVTGSGFSAPAGLPQQSGLLADIAKNREARNALVKIFNLKDTAGDDVLTGLQLEDIFTFLDKIILCGQSAVVSPGDAANTGEIPIIDAKAAYDYKKALIEYLIESVNKKLKDLRARHRYEHFFTGIVERKIERGETNTIVTLNWDTIPDFYINKAYKDTARIAGPQKGGVDYGVYEWDADTIDDEYSDYVPSILRKAQGWSTVKLLKLHGSMNWALSKKDNALYVKPQTGAYPGGLDIEEHLKKHFDRVFMTPTFLKDLSNLHTRTIWHNAAFDLAEAKRVVFIGCALQTADYEFRNLLLRTAARYPDKKIRALLYPGAPREEKETIRRRYKTLFPRQDTQFEETDAADFLLDDDLIWRW